MWEVFKFLLLCLISIIIGLTASFIYVCALLIVLVLVFYDFDFAVGLEHHAINKFNNLYLKVKNYYLKSKTTLHVEQPNTITDSFLYSPIMNSINKQTSSFELSRFNKSGNALSPITNSVSSTTLSSRRLVQARQTSTPLTKTPPWQQSATNSIRSSHINSSLMNRSPRYSLSSVNASPKADGSPKPTIQTVTGPLLASTRFNVNLGTYMDTKSPGLASRVVQYNNELSGEQSSTHQAKYGSPGQFPIVQLYKKELPILARTPRRCTVRIAPPDPVSYSSDHASTILRDSFMQKNIDNTSKQDQCDTEINTKSVLEALKEISRKRIHTNDDLEDISKRQRKNSIHSPDHLNKDGKRMREVTPPKPKDASNTTPINSAPKRICVVNEIESSLSSSRLMRLQQGQKRKSTVDLSENNKQRKISNGELVSKETQTISNGFKSNTLSTSTSTNTSTSKISTAAQTETEKPEQPINNVQSILESARRKKNSDRRTIDDIDEENSTLQFSEVNKKTTKPFFSEAPLEILKQNKLAVMISALSGQKAELIPLPVMTLSALKKRAEEDKTDGGETKEVVSILSPKNKIKHDKHVTFSIPSSESESNSKSDEISSVAASSAPSTIDTISFNPLSSQIVASNPVQFSTPSTTSSSSNSISVPKSNFNFSSAITATSMPSPSNNISFGPITTTTVSTNIITSSIENKGNISLESQNKPSTAPTTFNSSFEPLKTNFGGLVPSSNSEKSESTKSTTSFPISSTTSMPKLATTSTTSSNMFGIGTSNSLTFPASSVNNVSQPTIVFSNSNPPAFSIPTTSATSAPNTIGAALNQQPSILPTSNTTSASNFFNFGAKTDSKATPAVNTSMGHRSGGFVFDLRTTTATSTTKTEPSKPPPAFNTGSAQNTFTFGATTTASVSLPTTSAITFGTPISSTATTTSSAPIFGATSTNAFGTSTTLANTSGFSAPSSTAKNLFGISTTAKTGVFNTNTTTASSGMFGSTGVFGNANTSTNSTPATSITTTSSNVFGAPTTQTTPGIFGSSAAPSTFGSTKTDNPPPPAFGSFGTANTTQNTAGFRAFSAPTTTQNATSFTAFGSTATTQANSFGSTPTTTQNTTFGNVPTTTQNNTFGSIATTTQNATFGSAPATTNKAFTFGASTTPKEFSFGSSTTATTTASNVFGTTTSTPTASNLFGGNANSAFRNATTTPSNAFGAATTTTTTAPSTFGQSSSGVFGTANNTSFNNNATGSVFGGNNNNNNSSAFGTTAPSVFGATNQPASSFAAPGTSNVFGGGNNNASQTSNTMFGTKTNNTTFGSNTNAFGTSGFNNNNNGGNNNTAPAPSFGNFGSPAAAQPAAPQSSGVFAFGSSAPPATAAPTASNAFQFGAATQTPKPGGFNFSGSSAPNINFGSGATPSFSASPAPAFGSPAPSGFNANAPATGMFNIGSGSTAPKQRPMIKARRRN